MTNDEMANGVAEFMATLLSALTPMTEAMTGYRNQLEAGGYSPTMAEHIAAHVHTELVSACFRQMTNDADRSTS